MKKLQFLLATMIFSVASFLLPGLVTKSFATTPPAANDNYGSIRLSALGLDSIALTLTDVNNANSATAQVNIPSVSGPIAELTITGAGIYTDGNNTVYANGEVTIDATILPDYTASLWKDGTDQHSLTTSITGLTVGVHKNVDIQFDNGTTPPGPSTPEHNPDDTNAWFIWNCNVDLCRYKLTGLTLASETPSHELLYTTNYIKASDVKDVNDNTKVLDLNALLELEKATAPNGFAPYYFIYDDCIMNGSTPDTSTCAEGIATITKWSEFQSWWNTHITDYDSQRNFAIDPTGASAGANIISTNGDRRFRATIYDESDYYGISNASSPADLTYYPSYWDPAFFNPAYDVSGTTLENPMIIQSYLLEPQIVLKNDGISGEISSLEVASANIPTQAITITKQNDGSYKIIFNSRYFDNVTFRITSGGKTYYVAIVRTVVGHVLDPIDDHKRVLGLFVPTEVTKSYDVLATYYWADGTEKTFTMEEMQIGDDGGKGLAMRPYQLKSADASQVDVTPTSANPPIGVSYIAVESGSTTSTFKGALSGSGKGTYYKIDHGNYELVTK